MTIFVSPQPHERATWQADMRRAIAALQAEAAARKAQGEHAVAFGACQDAHNLKTQQHV